MGYKNNILTESDSRLIREMYGLLTEQNFKSPNGGKAQVISKFAPGYYSLNHKGKDGTVFNNASLLQPIIDEAKTFLTSNKGYIPRVIINAGESIIPNYDSEGGTGKKPIGWLSEQRKNKISEYIKSQFREFVNKKIISKDPDILLYFDEAKTLTEPSGGWNDYQKWRKSTEQEKTSNPKNVEYVNLKKGYDNDQFTKINFTIVPDLGANQCLFNVRLGIHYDDLSIGHKCNNARFKILANGVPLTTTDGTCGGNLPYADMNNGGGTFDCKGSKDVGGKRTNFFQLKNADVINKIMAASPDKNSIKITMECVSTGYNDSAGRCHQDVPHVVVVNTDGVVTVNTYPKKNDSKLIEIDKCGNLLSGGGGTATKSADAAKSKNTETAQTKTVGKKLNFSSPSTGTITSDQAILNKISSGEVSKNTNGTYSVLKDFSYNGLNFAKGDTIMKILPKGTSIT